CGHDYFVAFSCKGRGVCPSCTTRRMVETAAHLNDHVYFHVCVVDGVFEELVGEGAAQPQAQATAPRVIFHPAI
ncbi:transposase zinc-binding domain-containing protein, partial [Aeromonas caviae]|uniref:transposase zinc-binding domain-containing protein n=1 Tax=Aeromonas caviae TaxID=648 RepID=UPI001FB92318